MPAPTPPQAGYYWVKDRHDGETLIAECVEKETWFGDDMSKEYWWHFMGTEIEYTDEQMKDTHEILKRVEGYVANEFEFRCRACETICIYKLRCGMIRNYPTKCPFDLMRCVWERVK